ncbi:MAG: hypothetical protein ACYDER_22690, partial [Ktedonobacteraceae bacterium]
MRGKKDRQSSLCQQSRQSNRYLIQKKPTTKYRYLIQRKPTTKYRYLIQKKLTTKYRSRYLEVGVERFMAFPYRETCQQLFHPLLKGRVASAHLPVSALHIPPQDATAARPFMLQGKHPNSKGAAHR